MHGGRLEQSRLLIRTRSIGNEIQKSPRILDGFLDQPHVAPADRLELSHHISEEGSLGSDLLGKRLFEVVGEPQEGKFLVRNPEYTGEIAAEANHLVFQSAEFDIKCLLDFIALENGIQPALNQQSGFSPCVFNEVAVDFYFFADDSQEIRNHGVHNSDPEVDMLRRYGFFGIPRFIKRLAGFVFPGRLWLQISRLLRVVSPDPFFSADSFEER
jgi:hypothetical protein